MTTTEYATLEEAFGVASFVAPDPPVLRGNVADIQKQRYERMDQEIETPLPMHAPIVPPTVTRRPLEATRCGIVAQAHAEGGAKAAWDVIPECARIDMMWYAIRELVATEFLTMIFVAICLYILLK